MREGAGFVVLVGERREGASCATPEGHVRQEGPRPTSLTQQQPTSPWRQARPLADERVAELQPQRLLRCGLDDGIEPRERPNDVVGKRRAQEVVEQWRKAVDVRRVEVMPVLAVHENIAN